MSKKTLQALRARDKGGRFRTRGRYTAGTVRGTSWITAERCDGTLIKVRSGAVEVSDVASLVRGGGGPGGPRPAPTTTVVRAGDSHLARRG